MTPLLFLHGVIDNNDFLEETLRGNNITHVTTMVLYQEKSSVSCNNEVRLASVESLKNIDISSLSSPH